MGLTRDQKAELLRSVELFAGLDAEALASIGDHATEVSYPAGRWIVRQGEIGTGFFLIVSGRARVVRDDDLLTELGPGDFFGELALVDQQPRIAHVITDEPTDCLAIASWDLRRRRDLHGSPWRSAGVVRRLRDRGVPPSPRHEGSRNFLSASASAVEARRPDSLRTISTSAIELIVIPRDACHLSAVAMLTRPAVSAGSRPADPGASGPYRLDQTAPSGIIVEMVPGRRLAYTWAWEDAEPRQETLVSWELEPQAGGGCRVTLRHEGWSAAGADEAARDDHAGYWQGYLDDLVDLLAGDAGSTR
jgi:hypothetical protein